MKIGVIMPLAEQRGGAELMLIHLLRANKQHVNVDYIVVFLEDGPMVNTVKSMGYQVDVIPAGRLRDLSRYITVVWKLRSWIRKHTLTSVMSWMSKAHLYAGPAARIEGIPAVWWQHGLGNKSRLQRVIDNIPAEAVLCCSSATEKSQKKITPKKPTQVIYPAIQEEKVEKILKQTMIETRDQLQLPKEKFIVGIAARLQRWKGVHIFLEAAEIVLRERPDMYFVVIGGEHFSEKNYAEELREQARKAGMSESVYFAGHQNDPLFWMQSLNVLVHASIEYEPFGMVVIEGMSLGKAVVATKSGGPEEIISSGKNGLLIKPQDPQELAESLIDLRDNYEYVDEIGRMGMERASEFHSKRLAIEVGTFMDSIDSSRFYKERSNLG